MPRILVVDDEPDICQMIRRYAEHDGYDTVGVSDGTEAVAVCRKEDFKPFSPKELMARIHVIMRRYKKSPTAQPGPEDRLTFGGLSLDTRGHDLYVDGGKTGLTAKEYDLLKYFIDNKGIVLTRDQILSAVWGYDYYGEDRTVDWQVKLLRNKLGGYRDMIHTIRGVGYKFDE